DNTPATLQVLDPMRMQAAVESGRAVYRYQLDSGRQADYSLGNRAAGDLAHVRYLELPGVLCGLGPIQAARAELTGAVQVRDYAAEWFDRSGVPDGVL